MKRAIYAAGLAASLSFFAAGCSGDKTAANSPASDQKTSSAVHAARAVATPTPSSRAVAAPATRASAGMATPAPTPSARAVQATPAASTPTSSTPAPTPASAAAPAGAEPPMLTPLPLTDEDTGEDFTQSRMSTLNEAFGELPPDEARRRFVAYAERQYNERAGHANLLLEEVDTISSETRLSLTSSLTEARQLVEKLQKSSVETWETLRDPMENALSDMETAYDNAIEEMNK